MVVDGTIAIALITGLVQAVKLAGVNTKYAPLIAVALGIIVGLILNFSVMGGLAGIVYGLSSSGLYSVIKITAAETIKPTE